MTNPFRRYGAASLLMYGEAWVVGPIERDETTAKATLGPSTWLGIGCSEGKADISGETCPACASRAGVRALIVPMQFVPKGRAVRGAGSKTASREGG